MWEHATDLWEHATDVTRSILATMRCAAIGLLVAACLPDDPSGPMDVWVVARPPGESRHRLTVKRIDTLESLFEVRGQATVVRTSAALKAEVRGNTIPRDPEVYRTALRVLGGGAPVAQFVSEGGGDSGPWLAEDYHSLAMATFYHHLEAGRAHFTALGAEHALPDRIPTWYTPAFSGSMFGPLGGLTDNAGYLPTLHGFLLFERAILAEVPLPLNGIVVTHELSHAIFEAIANGREGVPAWIRHGWPHEAGNLERSLNEGLADLFAALQFDEPDILGESAAAFAEDRDLDADLFDILTVPDSDEAPETYNPYPLGTLIASALWRHAQSLGDPLKVGRATLTALAQVREREGDGPFTLDRFFTPLIQATPASQRLALCTRLQLGVPGHMAPDPLLCSNQ